MEKWVAKDQADILNNHLKVHTRNHHCKPFKDPKAHPHILVDKTKPWDRVTSLEEIQNGEGETAGNYIEAPGLDGHHERERSRASTT